MRILKDKKPKSFLLENVKGLMSLQKGTTFKNMLNELRRLKYKIYWKVLNTMEYSNIPQTRERVYIVGFKDNLKTHFDFPNKTVLNKTIQDMLFKEKQDHYYYYDRFDCYKVLKKEITKKDSIYQWRRTYVRENKSKVCPTLTANTGTGGHNVPLILDDYGHRKLTPRECARFQGFPEDFILPHSLSKSHLYKQIGNSVSVPVVSRIAKNMIRSLRHTKKDCQIKRQVFQMSLAM